MSCSTRKSVKRSGVMPWRRRVGLVAHTPVADRKDVLVVPMEPLVPDHATDLVVSESKVPQLRARDHPVLACGKPRQSPLTRLTNVCSARRFVDH